MNGWHTMELGQIAASVDYGVTASATQLPIGPKFLRITDIQNGSVDWEQVPWCQCDHRSATESRLRSGDIVFARTGATTGKSFLIRECPPEAVFASYLIRVRLGSQADSKYVHQFFQTPDYWAQITRSARGAAQPGVNASTLKVLKVPLPEVAEQRRIAAILDKAEGLRRKRRAALAQLDTLIQANFVEVFGNPVVSRATWPIMTLDEACGKITDGTHNSPPILAKGIPYVTAKHLKEHGLDFKSDPWFISEADHCQIFARCDPRQGDVLYIKDGATTGIAAINHYNYEFSMLSSLALLRPSPSALVSEYLCSWLNNPLVKRELLGGMAGAAIRRLTIAKLKAIRIPIPPLKLQHEFARFVASVEKLKAAYHTSLGATDALFASLQHRAFRGEL